MFQAIFTSVLHTPMSDDGEKGAEGEMRGWGRDKKEYGRGR